MTAHDDRSGNRVPQPCLQSFTTTVEEAAELLSVSSWALYKAIREGQSPVPIIRVGRRILVPTAHLRRLVGIEADQ
jgi:excisionase family DNA binding protein